MKQMLTDSEIDTLFTFVRKKYVRYVDLQYELVDHLATGIEERQAQDPDLTFQQALDQVYGGFPVTGFSRFVEQQEKALHRYWMRRVWSYIGSYMKLPKLLGTATLWATILAAYQTFGSVALTVILIATAAYALYAVYCSHQLFADDRSQIQKYLFINVFQGITGTGVFAPIAMINVLDFDKVISYPLLSIPVLGISLILTLSLVWSHAVTTAFPDMLREELQSKYAHLQIAI